MILECELNKQYKKIDINELITLCELGENYKIFCTELEELIKSKKNKDIVFDLYNVIQGKFSIHSNKYKSFIKKHKSTIEIMNKNFCLMNLTVLSYDPKGNRKENLSEDYFYEYLKNNKKNIEIIKEILLKLKKIGFKRINYGENLDFTGIDYSLDLIYTDDFVFLENIEVNSTYLNNPIKYRTKSSHYCMHFGVNGYGDEKEISEYAKDIYLNSLILNPNNIPDEITIESTFNLIKDKFNNKKSEISDIRNYIDLSIATDDLINNFLILKRTVSNIDDVKNNQEMLDLLNQMKIIMDKLKNIDENFEQKIIDSNESLTEKLIEKEKKLYLDRRNCINID